MDKTVETEGQEGETVQVWREAQENRRETKLQKKSKDDTKT